MRKIAALAAVVTISLGALTACSGGAYCSSLKDNLDAAKASQSDIPAAIEKMKKLRDDAPSDIKKDWDALIGFMEKSEAAKKDTSKAGELAAESAKIQAAAENIEKHAKDECKVTLDK